MAIKMLLTEHQEQYESRNHQLVGPVTSEELTMIRDYVLLPHFLTIFQNCLDEVQSSSNVLKGCSRNLRSYL